MNIISEMMPLIIDCTEMYVYVCENYPLIIDWTKWTLLYPVLLFKTNLFYWLRFCTRNTRIL